MMYEPSKLDLTQMIGEEVSRLRRERDQLKEINDRMAEDRLRLVAELEGWKDNAEDTLRMYDKLKAESNELQTRLDALHTVPDATEMNRGFGNCPHCRAPRVAHCHECLNDIERDAAHAAGWRMDHLSGYGCIAVCPDCRNDNTKEDR